MTNFLQEVKDKIDKLDPNLSVYQSVYELYSLTDEKIVKLHKKLIN